MAEVEVMVELHAPEQVVRATAAANIWIRIKLGVM